MISLGTVFRSGTVHTRDLEEFTEEGFAEQQALGGLGDETHTRRFEWVGL